MAGILFWLGRIHLQLLLLYRMPMEYRVYKITPWNDLTHGVESYCNTRHLPDAGDGIDVSYKIKEVTYRTNHHQK